MTRAGKVDRITINFLKDLQLAIAGRAVFEGVQVEKIRYVAALDISYSSGGSRSAAIVWDCEARNIIEVKTLESKPFFPYIPGYLFIREAPQMIAAFKSLESKPDLILVDGHGIAHPRRAGLAVFVGMLLDQPTLGVAKSLLVGEVEESSDLLIAIRLQECTVGFAMKADETKRIYISPGYKVSLQNISEVVEHIGPEYILKIIRMADRYSRAEDSK